MCFLKKWIFLLLPSLALANTEHPEIVQLGVQHVTAPGIGYKEGFTSVTAYAFAPTPLRYCTVPFIDLRGHIFDNGTGALNVGGGLRFLNRRVWGIYGYYDYRRAFDINFQQWSIGLESLGKWWDIRANTYQHFGEFQTAPFKPCFAAFCGNHALIRSSIQQALRLVNVELNFHTPSYKCLAADFDIGPYYLFDETRNALGVQGRATFKMLPYVELAFWGSYDNFFKTILQGRFALRFPLGPRACKSPNSCCNPQYPIDSLCRKPRRHEIIPIKEFTDCSRAIDPCSGLPYKFLFVNNTSSSDGTFESPFPTLAQAENASYPGNIIYIFPGDGTSTGLSGGIQLKDRQKLLGAGTLHPLQTTLGTIAIPAQTTGKPVLESQLVANVIDCANDNEIAGLEIRGINVKGVSAIDIRNICIRDNFFYGRPTQFTPVTVGPVFFDTCSGTCTVRKNTLELDNVNLAGPISAIWVSRTAAGTDYNFTCNTIYELESPLAPGSASSAFEFGFGREGYFVGDFGTITITNNLITDIGDTLAGKVLGGNGFNGRGTIIVDSNRMIRTAVRTTLTNPPATMYFRMRDGANIHLTFTNNTWQKTETLSKGSFAIEHFGPDTYSCTRLDGNVTDTTPNGYMFLQKTFGTMVLDEGSNVGPINENGTVLRGSCSPPSSCSPCCR